MASQSTGREAVSGTGEKRQAEPQKSEITRGERQQGLSRGGREWPQSPFGMMRRMFDEMDRFFGGGFALEEPFRGIESRLPRSLWSPRIEVREKEGKLLVHADLPGLEESDIRVDVEDDVLTLSGERRNENEGEREGVYHSECSYGRFERRIALPQGTDPNTIDAKFENGVLEISAVLPKREERARKIEVKGRRGELGGGEKKQSH